MRVQQEQKKRRWSISLLLTERKAAGAVNIASAPGAQAKLASNRFAGKNRRTIDGDTTL
jgi:hypothetical protein